MAGEWVSGHTDFQLIENNQGVDSYTLKRKLEKEAHREEDDRENEEPTIKKPMVEKVNQTHKNIAHLNQMSIRTKNPFSQTSLT